MGSRRRNRYCYRVKLSAYVRAYKMMYQSEDEDEDEDEEESEEEDEEDEGDVLVEDNDGCTFCEKLRLAKKVSFMENLTSKRTLLFVTNKSLFPAFHAAE